LVSRSDEIAGLDFYLGNQALETLPAPTTHPSADLSITVADEAAVAGQRGTYTIVVTNAGPSDVTGTVVTDSFRPIFTGVNLYRDAGRSGVKSRANFGNGWFCNVFI
jgi:hypothetical protein